MYFDSWTCEALENLPDYFKHILDEVAQINLYKMKENRKHFRKNDYGFEQAMVTYLAEKFIRNIRNLPNNLELGIAETLTKTKLESNKQPDFSLVKKDDGTVIEVMEVKTIIDNNFSWLREDVCKLRELDEVQNKFLLSINLYISRSAYTQTIKRLSKFMENDKNNSLSILCHGLLYRSRHGVQNFQLTYYYYLFKI
ncbi:hypothetical protein [Aquifex aeolicus]|uniref:Uncharacterized protein aq_aa32 n=1 Tax=Aquifex aeolicus (strain VF5) TaxID=224324 RepID=YZ32_AQUAE|nr:hypothetical protein [Aquifex aeolicus]O66422.1 RecName: Full=Uncharacterized protein aq_aa32 [Aquifex aeolicus VF5]AAC07974.1 putative protein [Aquifex aeolicus VF5]